MMDALFVTDIGCYPLMPARMAFLAQVGTRPAPSFITKVGARCPVVQFCANSAAYFALFVIPFDVVKGDFSKVIARFHKRFCLDVFCGKSFAALTCIAVLRVPCGIGCSHDAPTATATFITLFSVVFYDIKA